MRRNYWKARGYPIHGERSWWTAYGWLVLSTGLLAGMALCAWIAGGNP